MRLLLTRPEPDAARSADALRQRGHAVLVAPLTRLEPVAAEFSGPFAALLMTSANAVRAAAQHARASELRMLPVVTVGARTAQVARAAGFADVTSADGALGDLVRLVAARVQHGARVLYLAGEHRAGDVGGDLARHGIAVETAVIYRAAAREELAGDLLAGLGSLDGALHYSRRSAEILLRLADRAGVLGPMLGLSHYCLSAEVARPLQAAGAARLKVAAHPDENALFALI